MQSHSSTKIINQTRDNDHMTSVSATTTLVIQIIVCKFFSFPPVSYKQQQYGTTKNTAFHYITWPQILASITRDFTKKTARNE